MSTRIYLGVESLKSDQEKEIAEKKQRLEEVTNYIFVGHYIPKLILFLYFFVIKLKKQNADKKKALQAKEIKGILRRIFLKLKYTYKNIF